MLAYGWNLQNRRGLPILALCEAKSIEVHLAGCFWFGDYGVLFDASRTDDEQVLEARRGWERLAARHGVSLAAVALAFAALPAVVGKVVVGMATPDEVAVSARPAYRRLFSLGCVLNTQHRCPAGVCAR